MLWTVGTGLIRLFGLKYTHSGPNYAYIHVVVTVIVLSKLLGIHLLPIVLYFTPVLDTRNFTEHEDLIDF